MSWWVTSGKSSYHFSVFQNIFSMTTTFFVIALIFAIIGVVWSVLPLLPWVVFSLVAMLIVEFGTYVDFGSTIWTIALILIALSIASDYVFPILGAKKGGWSKAGSRWSLLWLLAGIFIPPRWIILWPLLGAWIGERYVKRDAKHALRAARWSFLWSVWSTVIKLMTSWMVVYWVIAAWIG